MDCSRLSPCSSLTECVLWARSPSFIIPAAGREKYTLDADVIPLRALILLHCDRQQLTNYLAMDGKRTFLGLTVPRNTSTFDAVSSRRASLRCTNLHSGKRENSEPILPCLDPFLFYALLLRFRSLLCPRIASNFVPYFVFLSFFHSELFYPAG